MLTVDPYPYQNEAIDMGLERGNLLVAYGMGLGKTLVQLAICEELLGQNESTLNAIVVPATLKWQWAQAIAWATDVDTREVVLKPRSKDPQRITIPRLHHAVVIDGTIPKRDEQYAYIRRMRPDYVILGYDNVVNDWRQVRRMKPDLIALDEATAIKNFAAERSNMIKQWWAEYRFALTGTPIDNRPDELFSIMEWVDPTELGEFEYFDKTYVKRDGNRIRGYRNLDVLHRKTKKFVARKTRFDKDVAPYMPKDVHRSIYIDLDHSKTRKLYQKVAREMVDLLGQITGYGGFDIGAYYRGESASQGSEEMGEAMARFGVLAMLVDHPRLVVSSAMKFKAWLENAENGVLTNQQGSKYAYQLLMDGELDWVTDKTPSPKFTAVLSQINDILDEREENKVILFSFNKEMLRIFRDALPKGMAVVYDGDMGTVERERAKQQFKHDSDVRVFLSSDAGGMGVDLPEANYLINYNHPWSAGKADQRNNRHVRAGSKWDEVWVLNFIVSGSVEEWKFRILDLKRRVGSAIMDGGPTAKGEITFDVGSLLSWVSESSV